jgi:hypothetical protein
VDRWEQHFREKSARRFEADRLERRRQRLRLSIAVLVAVVLFLGAAIGLALLR